MPEIRRYKELIQNLPVWEHCDSTKIKHWAKIEKANPDIKKASDYLKSILRLDEDVFTISRKDCFDVNRDLANPELFALAVIYWGYPTGGRGNNISKLLSERNFNSLKKYILKLMDEKSYNSVDELVGNEKLDRMNISTYSKFWHFQNIEINGNRCLILDSRIIDTINKKVFTELNFETKFQVTGFKDYENYIEKMNKISQDIGVYVDKLEYFLYLFGSSIKQKRDGEGGV